MPTKTEFKEEKLDETIRFRAGKSLRPRLIEIAHSNHRKYQAQARLILQEYVERWEQQKQRRKTKTPA